jgi:hypothetical protein
VSEREYQPAWYNPLRVVEKMNTILKWDSLIRLSNWARYREAASAWIKISGPMKPSVYTERAWTFTYPWFPFTKVTYRALVDQYGRVRYRLGEVDRTDNDETADSRTVDSRTMGFDMVLKLPGGDLVLVDGADINGKMLAERGAIQHESSPKNAVVGNMSLSVF